MLYNFNEIIKRDDTLSMKWNPEIYKHQFNQKTDLLPLWVADMDFAVSESILKRFHKLLNGKIFGYTGFDAEYYEAIARWFKKMHAVDIKQDTVVFTPGIVPSINFTVQACTNVGDGVLIQRPVYYPFTNAIKNNQRTLINSPLIESSPGYYTVDYAGFEQKIIDNKVRLFILCNPHNPVGRVWSREELETMAQICVKHNVLILSDEIHCDLIFYGAKFTSLLSLSDEIVNNSVVCNAVSKTFNLAGLQVSNNIIVNQEIRSRFQKKLEECHITLPNSFAVEAVKASYLESDDWYSQMLNYIEENITFASEFITKNISPLSMRKHEGTYLGWIDTRKLNLNKDQLATLCEDKAKIALDYGEWFGDEGHGFIRINLACPRSILEEALKRLQMAVKSL